MAKAFLLIICVSFHIATSSAIGDVNTELELTHMEEFSKIVLQDEVYRRQLIEEMSDDCLDKMCRMLQTFFSCQAFPVQWDKTCAKYFMGYLFQCPVYPSRDEITEAPSICLPELMRVQQMGLPNMSDIATSGNRSDDCQLDCYQRYLERGLDFFESCSAEVANSPHQKVAQLGLFQVYRAEVCAFNGEGDNCVDELFRLLPDPSDPNPPPSPLFDYSCPYPDTVYSSLCAAFTPMGCCFGNQFTILEQTFNKLYAPCAMDKLSALCPTVNLTGFCAEGTLRDLGTIEATVAMQLSVDQGLPDMSVENNVTYFRAVVAGALQLTPLQIAIVSYNYYNSDGDATSDISVAVRGVFNYAVVMVSTTNETWTGNVNLMETTTYEAAIAGGYLTDVSNIAVTVTSDSYYAADPIDTSGAFAMIPRPVLMTLSSLVVVVLILL